MSTLLGADFPRNRIRNELGKLLHYNLLRVGVRLLALLSIRLIEHAFAMGVL
jgi:hypothetical protein